MHCGFCHNEYNQTTNIPRLLIYCGHTLCDACCRKRQANDRVQCPQCHGNTVIQDINYLPKNLALFNLNHHLGAPTTDHGSECMCLKHEKKYEAFCDKEKTLLCVDCILQDGHRNHDMASIKQSYSQQSGILSQKLEKLEAELEGIKQKHLHNMQNETESFGNYTACKESLHASFSFLRELIDRQLQAFLKKVEDQYSVVFERSKQKKQSYQQRIADISSCIEALNKSCSTLDQVAFLENVPTQTAMLESLRINTEDIEQILALTFTKNQIADSLIKDVNSQFKTGQSVLKKAESIGHGKPVKKAQTHLQTPNHAQVLNKNSKRPYRRQIQPGSNSMLQSEVIPNNRHGNGSNRQSQNAGSASREKKQKSSVTGTNKPLQRYDMNKCCDLSVVEQKESMCNSFLSNMTSFLNEKKFIYILGGFQQENIDIIKLNLSNFGWEKVGKLTSPRSKFGCAYLDKKILMIGGKKGRERVADSQIWEDGSWQLGTNLRKKRSGFGIACVGSFLYIIGGNDGDSILSSVQCLDTKSGEWRKKSPMNQTRDELAVCVGRDDSIYAIGGFGGNNNEPLTTSQVYDIKADRWSPIPCLKTPRRALAAACLVDGIYAVGGYDGQKYLSSVQRYEEGSNEWVKVVSLNKARCTHSAVSIFDSQEILVFGGFDEVALDSVERYSLVSNEWDTVTKMPAPRFMHSSLVINE